METLIKVNHLQVPLKSSYDAFRKNLEKIVNKLDQEYARDVLKAPESLKEYLAGLGGITGLIIFGTQSHGDLLNIYGKPRKAIQYIIGNPLVAIQMTVHDIRAALYAPLRMIVYEDSNGQVMAEYDQPSTLFGQFGNDDILKVALDLDAKMLNLISMADR
ncbi:MAG: hypothetical protein JWQ66_570 [Mucilaginibacter sp.]|nr:hypothetical protein [Mucilaginibacter sp.]